MLFRSHLFKKDTNSKFTNGSLVSIIEKLSEDIDTLKNTHKHELSVKENDKKEILAKTEKYVKQIDGLKESVKNIKAKFRAQLSLSMKNINNRLNSLNKQIENVMKLVNGKPKINFPGLRTATTPQAHRPKIHSHTKSSFAERSFIIPDCERNLINELNELRRENVTLKQRLYSYPIDIEILKKKIITIQKTSSTTIYELQIQNNKWKTSFEKCIQDYKKLQNNFTILKVEHVDSSDYIRELQFRLENMKMMYNYCGKRNCELESGVAAQKEKII